MQERQIEFASAARSFAGVLIEPGSASVQQGRSRPGVLVLHGGAGPGAHERERALRLVELGYVAFIPNLFGEPFESREHGMSVIRGLVDDPAALRTRLADALAFLQGQTRVDASRLAAIGFCFGGLAALELARSGATMRVAASFHGGLSTRAPARPGAIRASVLVCTGAADPYVPREQRAAFEDEMNGAGADWQLSLYAHAQHGFTERGANRPGCAHDARADRRSWRALLDLFAEKLGSEA
ncbi:MAG TPA: dienelactone hydrolase family protein [Polyangiaceae bacterium]|nr:dienelactone hydrolase family protein [Polyangiaceae bacterium]